MGRTKAINNNSNILTNNNSNTYNNNNNSDLVNVSNELCDIKTCNTYTEIIKSENNQQQTKGKRGRKPKNLLNQNNINTIQCSNNIECLLEENNLNINNNTDLINEIICDNIHENNVLTIDNQKNDCINEDNKPIIKKRGRKPKGGKIIQQILPNDLNSNLRPNVILDLKCSLKDLETNINNSDIESYNLSSSKDLCYEIIGNNDSFKDNTNVNNLDNATLINDYSEINYGDNSNKINNSSNLDDNEFDDCDDNSYCFNKDLNSKVIWKKLKILEKDLHINNITNKKCACFWDTCDFDNPPVHIIKHFLNGTYEAYGCFCSPECGVAFLMNEHLDGSIKFERYHLMNNIYGKIYEYNKNIKPAPNPYYMLDKYFGNLSIQEYRSLLKNERLFLIVDKPLTRILPELHEDNEDFIINNKIIPSNTYQIKKKIQKKSQSKNNILNEKFGINQ